MSRIIHHLPIAAQQAGKRVNLILLVLAIMIVAADKTVFAFAGPAIMAQLHLSAEQFGMVGGAFFFLYSLSGIGVGLLMNRIPTRWVLLGLAVIWSFCQAGIGLSAGLAALVVFRMVLGVGAGPSTAVVQFSCTKWFAPHRRVFPASVINAALMAGVLVAALCLPAMITHWGWRHSYLFLGGLSAIWAVIWVWQGREGQVPHAMLHETPASGLAYAQTNWVSYRYLLLNRTFVGMTILCFCGFMAAGLGLSWSPTYMEKALGYSPMTMGLATMVIMLFVIPSVLLVSRWSQYLLKKNLPYYVAMVLVPVGFALLGGIIYALMLEHRLAIPIKTLLLGLGFVLLNIPQSYGIIVCGNLSPDRQRGSVIAIHVALVTLAGVAAPVLAGWMVTLAQAHLGLGYERCLAVVGGMNLLASILCIALVRPERTRAAILARHMVA